MAAPQLTVGRYQPTALGSNNSPYFYGSGGYQPQQRKAPQGPGSWYGGDWQHPSTGYVPYTSTAGAPTVAPTIQTPQTAGIWTTPGTPAYTPDYSSMIGGSWEVGAAESAMAEQMAAARARLQNSLRSSFIDLGYTGDRAQLGDLSKYIDKATIQKAIDNKYSAYAQIKQQQDVANAFNQGDLIARGLGVSGTATETSADTIQRAEQARYEGLRNFLQGGASGLDNLANLKAQLANGVMQARFAAATRLAQMYPPTPAQPGVPYSWGGPEAGAPAPGNYAASPYGYDAGGNPVDFSGLWATDPAWMHAT